jgi:hypothetical protein
MNKTLRFSLISLLMMLCGTVFADSWVKTAPASLQTGDVVVIADLTSLTAMSNDKGTSSAPAATAITLNEAGTEISSTVAANLQWVVTVSDGSYQFGVANTENYLYCTNSNNGVRVGTNANNAFTITQGGNNNCNFLVNTATSRYIGVYNGSDWRCYTSINANIKDCQTVFFKKAVAVSNVATPTFTPNGGTFVGRTSVEIACATEGATIYYSMNGEDPVAGSSPEYGRALPITETTIVKAIAVKGNDQSAVASATFTQIPSYSSFASMSELASNAIFAYTGQAMIMAKPTAKYVYLYDGNDFSLIYDNSGEKTDAAEIGKYITPNWTGKVNIYNKLFELVPDNAIVVNDDPAQPVSYPAVAIGNAKMNQVITLKDVTSYSVSGKNISVYINGEDKELNEASGFKTYNQFGITIPEFEEGKTYQIVGAIGQYGDQKQFLPIEITEQVEETPEPDPSFYIVGSMTNWAIDANYQMTLNEELEQQGTKEFSVTMTLSANDEFKAVSSTDGETIKSWFPGGEGNNYVITEDGEYTIYFRPNYDGNDDWHYKVLYVAKALDPLDAAKTALQTAIGLASNINPEGLADAISAAQTALNAEGATVESIAQAAQTLEAAIKAYFGQVLPNLGAIVLGLNDETLNGAYADAQAVLEKEDATPQELAAAMQNIITIAQRVAPAHLENLKGYAVKYGAEQAVTLVDNALAAIQSGNVSEIIAKMAAVREAATPLAQQVLSGITAYVEQFGLTEQAAQAQAALESGNYVTMITVAKALFNHLIDAAKGYLPKLAIIAEGLNDETLNEAYADAKTLLESESITPEDLGTAMQKIIAAAKVAAPEHLQNLRAYAVKYGAEGTATLVDNALAAIEAGNVSQIIATMTAVKEAATPLASRILQQIIGYAQSYTSFADDVTEAQAVLRGGNYITMITTAKALYAKLIAAATDYVASAKAIPTEGKEGANDLNTAIEAAEQALAAQDADFSAINTAISALVAAVRAFEAANAEYYVVGNMNEWTISNEYKMAFNKDAEGAVEYILTLELQANAELKVVDNNENWYPGDGGNFTINDAGNYTIYFRPNYDGNDDWHYNVLYAAKNETPEPAQKASVTYALSTGDTFTSAQTVEVKNDGATVATITYGETGGADFKAAKSDGHIDGFTAFTEGNGTNGNKEGGTFYTIVPNYDGKIAVGVVLNADKAFYVEEDGTALADYDGITVTEKYYGTYEFEVTANKSYKFYCAGSKLGFYGFNYEYVAAAPLNKYTATFDNAGGWEEVYAYAWSTTGEGDEAVTTKFLGDWPGTKIEAVEGVYTVTIEAEAAPDSIIFTAGANGPQTEDLAFEDGKAYNYVVPAQTATFNFADPNFRENIGETMTDTKGYIYNETFTVDGVSLQITAGSAPSRVYTDSNRGQCLVTYKEYTTLTFNAPEGKAITKIEFTAAGNSNINNFRASSGAIEGMVWTGNAAGVRFLQGGTSYLANAIVTLEAATEATAALPAIEYTECANIAAFNALEAGTYAKLTLTNAEVIGKSADGFTTVWIQDATGGAWIQYTSLNDQLQEGTKVNGTIFTIKRFTSGNPQLKEAEATINSKFIAEAINAYTFVEGSIAEVNVAANLNKVVKISGATLTMTSTSVGKLTLGETSIDVNNGTATANQQLHKIADWEENKVLENVTITAILVAKSATANQLLPISIEQPVEEEKLYIIGNGTANAWAGTTEMTYKEETQAFEYIVESEGDIYIAFSDIEWTATNDGWDDFNANHRWAIDSGDKDATVGEALQLQKVNGTLKLAAGTYNVSVTKDMQCTITKTVPTGINAIAADRLNGVVYNLNGQKVLKAQKGLYIINGKKTMVK